MRLNTLMALAVVGLSILFFLVYDTLFALSGTADVSRPPPLVQHDKLAPVLKLASHGRWNLLRDRLGRTGFPPDTEVAFLTTSGKIIPLLRRLQRYPRDLVEKSIRAGTFVFEVHPGFVYQVYPVRGPSGRLTGHIVVRLGRGPLWLWERRPQMIWFRDSSLLLALATVMLIALWGARGHARSLENFCEAASALAEGKQTVLKPPDAPLELRRLARSFNAMSEQLQARVESLEQARASAQQADSLRREFIADIAHGVGTPLAAIQLGLLSLSSLEPAQRATAEAKLVSQIEWISQVSRRLLDLSVWEVVEPELRPGEFALLDLVMDVVETLEEPLLAAGMTLEIHCPRGLLVRADRGYVRDILIALLENSVEHSGGDCRLCIRAEHTGDRVVVTVRDEGVGMEPEQLQQSDRRHYTTGGTGLGLAIARRLVEAHGGRLSLAGEPGVGVEACFSLPAPQTGS